MLQAIQQKVLYSVENTFGHHPVQEAFWLFVENIWLVWLGVEAIILIQKITVYRSFARYVKTGIKTVSDIGLLDQISVIEEQINVSRAVELCVNPLVSSPLPIGFYRPCIVIPSTILITKRYIKVHCAVLYIPKTKLA